MSYRNGDSVDRSAAGVQPYEARGNLKRLLDLLSSQYFSAPLKYIHPKILESE